MGESFSEPNSFEGKVKVELDFMEKQRIWKMQQVFIHQNLLKKTDLASLKSNVDKLDIDKLKNVPSNSNNLKSKVAKLDVDKLVSDFDKSVPFPVDLSKLSDVVKKMSLQKMYIMLRSKILKIKYLTLLT